MLMGAGGGAGGAAGAAAGPTAAAVTSVKTEIELPQSISNKGKVTVGLAVKMKAKYLLEFLRNNGYPSASWDKHTVEYDGSNIVQVRYTGSSGALDANEGKAGDAEEDVVDDQSVTWSDLGLVAGATAKITICDDLDSRRSRSKIMDC
jgi:hypothetical protein